LIHETVPEQKYLEYNIREGENDEERKANQENRRGELQRTNRIGTSKGRVRMRGLIRMRMESWI